MKLIVSASIAVSTLALLSTDGSRNAVRLEQRLESAIESTYGKQVTVRPKVAVAKASSGVTGSNARQKAASSVELVTAVNGELRRLGCYHGSAESEWTQDSQQALVAFNRHLDAQMPVDKPDPTLLTILRGFREPACAEAQGVLSVHAAASIAPAQEQAPATPRTIAENAQGEPGNGKLSAVATAPIKIPAAVNEAKPKRVKPAVAVANARESTARKPTKRVAEAKAETRAKTATASVDRPSRPARASSSVAFNVKTAFDRMNKS